MVFTVLAWLAVGALAAAAALALYFAVLTRRIAAESERLVPARGRFVEIGGSRIHYVDEGAGRPILFIHGLGGQLHHFRHPLFKTLGRDYRLIALDRPGSGYSTRPAGSSGRLTEQAEVAAKFIDALKLERPLVVGHSLGGAVTLALALAHPDKISGIALIAPLTHMEDAVRPEFRALYIKSTFKRWLLAHTTAIPVARKYAPQTLAFVFSPQAAPADYMIEGGGHVGLRPSHFYATASDIVAIEHDLGAIEARYGEIAVPTGLLVGTADRVLDWSVHAAPMQGKIAGLDFESVEGLGHMPQFSETARTVAFIRRMAKQAFG